MVAEGTVQHEMENDRLDAVFCDVFAFRGDQIRQLTTYQVNR